MDVVGLNRATDAITVLDLSVCRAPTRAGLTGVINLQAVGLDFIMRGPKGDRGEPGQAGPPGEAVNIDGLNF
jgi:hypothetical protein